MRIRGPGIGILVALLVPADSALAANQTVTATSMDKFSPAAVTVFQGESVTWNNAGGFHNVHFDDNSFVMPAAVDNTLWSVSRPFPTVGTFSYYCEAHGNPGGQGMSGTVTVQAPGTTPGPGPGQPQPVGADKTPPALKLGGRTKQRVLRRRAVLVAVEVNEASTVVARGTVAVPSAGRVFRLKKASKQLAAGSKATLKLRLPKQSLRAFRRALARRSRLTARLTVTARDSAGNTRSAKRKVRFRK
jgi:plastocyanin